MVGEQIGEEGKSLLGPAPPTPPDCRPWAGVRGVSGGEGDRLPGRRMEGRNLRSRRRRGGVRGVRVPRAEVTGVIRGVGELVGPVS